MWADIIQYAWDLLDHWSAFMTGGIPVAILAVWERWRSRNVSFRFYVAIFLGFGFAAASFQTWRQENAGRLLAEQTDISARQRLAKKAELQKFFIEAGVLLNTPIDRAISDQDFKKYSDSVELWINTTGKWIRDNLGDAALAKFLDRSTTTFLMYDASVNTMHNNIINGLVSIRKNLSTLVETNAWDKT
jgi:hypothetical protein